MTFRAWWGKKIASQKRFPQQLKHERYLLRIVRLIATTTSIIRKVMYTTQLCYVKNSCIWINCYSIILCTVWHILSSGQSIFFFARGRDEEQFTKTHANLELKYKEFKNMLIWSFGVHAGLQLNGNSIFIYNCLLSLTIS